MKAYFFIIKNSDEKPKNLIQENNLQKNDSDPENSKNWAAPLYPKGLGKNRTLAKKF